MKATKFDNHDITAMLNMLAEDSSDGFMLRNKHHKQLIQLGKVAAHDGRDEGETLTVCAASATNCQTHALT